MEFQVQQAMEILERTPGVLRSLLSGLSEEWITANEGKETWSPKDVVAHLIGGEKTDWMARTRIILEQGTERPFDPFDRFTEIEASRDKSIAELLDEFESCREANLDELRSLGITEESLSKRGVHPDFGEVSLDQLLATWTVHDLNHIHQIVRTISRQYEEAVGPWKVYLGVLRRFAGAAG